MPSRKREGCQKWRLRDPDAGFAFKRGHLWQSGSLKKQTQRDRDPQVWAQGALPVKKKTGRNQVPLGGHVKCLQNDLGKLSQAMTRQCGSSAAAMARTRSGPLAGRGNRLDAKAGCEQQQGAAIPRSFWRPFRFHNQSAFSVRLLRSTTTLACEKPGVGKVQTWGSQAERGTAWMVNGAHV